MPETAKNWEQLFPDKDFDYRFGFRHGRPAEFFGTTPEKGDLLAERVRWLDARRDRYLGLAESGGGLLERALGLAQEWETLPFPPPSGTDLDRCEWLGRVWEPDFLLLRLEGGRFVLKGGCVCFPSSWSLEEKLDRSLAEIHGTVPGLNARLGRVIEGYLKRLPRDRVALRANWGLSRSPERNHHPALQRPKLVPPLRPDEVFLRMENQALVALDDDGGVLFGIRLEIRPLTELLREPSAVRGLTRALRTMPGTVARYKGLAAARDALIALLEEG